MVDDIVSESGEVAHHLGHFSFGANAINAVDQDWPFVLAEIGAEHGSEGPDSADDGLIMGLGNDFFNRFE